MTEGQETVHRQSGRSRTGFTLVEMLIVVAIIAVLAAIVSPSLAKAREKARQANCLSNLRQMGSAVLMYVQDYDETFPNGINRGRFGVIWAGAGWAGQTLPYYRSPSLAYCPSDPYGSPIGGDDVVVSYGININVIQYNDQSGYSGLSGVTGGSPPPYGTTAENVSNPDQTDTALPPSGHNFSSFTAPAHSVLLFEVTGISSNIKDPREGMAGSGVPGSDLSPSGNGLDNRLYGRQNFTTGIEHQYATGYLGGRPPYDPMATQFVFPLGRHTDGSNYVFADGHVKWFPGSRVSSGRNALAPECNQDNLPPLPGCTDVFRAAGTANRSFPATFSIE
jgi:prepilin-type N-terminal cleavage/methylation domain-containing protein/prepilin-type processing-associated H-X9-DG protein